MKVKELINRLTVIIAKPDVDKYSKVDWVIHFFTNPRDKEFKEGENFKINSDPIGKIISISVDDRSDRKYPWEQ